MTARCAHRHTSGRLARRGTLQRRAQVVVAVLQRTGEISVSRTRCSERRDGTPAPFLVIAILDQHGERRSDRNTLEQAAHDLHPIALDLHARTGSVAPLPSRQLSIDHVLVERQAGGQPFEDRDHSRAMGLTGGQET